MSVEPGVTLLCQRRRPVDGHTCGLRSFDRAPTVPDWPAASVVISSSISRSAILVDIHCKLVRVCCGGNQCLCGLDEHRRFRLYGRGWFDAWEPKRFAQWKQLIGIKPDASPKRCLKQVTIRCGRGVPLEGWQVGRESCGVIGAASAKPRPQIILQPPRADFHIPRDLEGFTLRVVRDTGTFQRRKAAAFVLNPLDQPRSATKLDEITDTGCLVLQSACTIKSGTAIMIQLKRLDTKSSRAFGPKMTGGKTRMPGPCRFEG